MPRFRTYKQRGEWVELKFMAEAVERGFNVSQPHGDSARYDVVVERDGHFRRVQVKSTSKRNVHGGGFCAQTHGANATYTAKEVDLIAVYVIPCRAWYLIPAALVAGKHSATLFPDRKKAARRGLFEQFREAWDLLLAA